MEGILLGIIGNIIRVYAIYRGMEVLFDSKKNFDGIKFQLIFVSFFLQAQDIILYIRFI